MVGLFAAILGVALAEDPAPPAGPEVIVVYGDLRVEQARQAILSDLQAQGFTKIIDRGDYLVLRHEDPWKGDVIVHDDGWVRMKRQPPRVESPDLPYARQGSALAWAHCVVIPTLCLRLSGPGVSRRRWLAAQDVTMGEIADEAQIFGDRVADRRVDDVVNDLPARLEALWSEGVPLLSDTPRLTTQEKKQEILDFWESRTDTIWGDRVRASVEAFVKGEIQGGPEAFTDAEIAAFNARRRCERDLDLSRDWEALFAAMAAGPG